jgi:VacB/RNase II family 3'-5' exoribonuclease
MITEQEIYRRRDMRDVFTFTIDPADAKDFDDAISYLRLENGNYQIGVHIADVTHFVLPGSEIDIVAYEKATSVYLVDEVFPMLPEALCNDLCSLRPNEEKLCMSIVFDISPDAHVIKHKVSRTVIKSDCRLSYEQADDLLKDKAVAIVPTIEKELKESLKELNVLAKQFRQKRIAKGALELEQEEMRFRLDENKFPIEIYFEQSTDAHQLIEEFMLLANRTIATLLAQSVPMVYRVHDLPNKEKMALLKRFTKRRGDTIPASTIKMLTMRAMA